MLYGLKFYSYIFFILLGSFAINANELKKLTLSEIEKSLEKELGLTRDWPISSALNKTTNLKKTKNNKDWSARTSAKSENWFNQKKRESEKWRDFRLKTLNRWQSKKKDYEKDIKVYKKNSVKLPIKEKQKTVQQQSNYQSSFRKKIIPEAFYRRALNQGPRPTCVAFASIRGIEILMAQKKKVINLSEQYFYYLSKPKCQQSPCSIPGSWAIAGLDAGISRGISAEKNCPYQFRSLGGNETQLPLKQSCYEAVVKIKKYKKVNSISELVEKIDQGKPVLVGMKLTENFYKNNGVVKWSPDLRKGSDQHADGHAALVVGYYKLSNANINTQGRYCFLTVNSWGEGWGVGGYSCLTEKWLEKQRYKVSMLAISDIDIIN